MVNEEEVRGREGEEHEDAVKVLAGYERRKHELAQILREMHADAYQTKHQALERQISDLTKKLAEDRFYLTVVGQFSRGKSTLMNAVLGKDYLPSGIVPVTSAITAVSYGSRERVVLRIAGSNLTTEIGIHELADFVTERMNPGNRNRIEMAEVQVPVEILQRGFFFVDTPGLGSAVRENTATTLNFLPNADAIVFVTSCDAPLTEGELGYLRQCRSAVRQMFLVVNKMDLVSSADRERVITFVKTKAQEELGDASVRVHALSARNALEARMTSDAAKLRDSGVPELETGLVNYITSQKRADSLLQACDRATELLRVRAVGRREELLARIADLRGEIEREAGSGESNRSSHAPRPSVSGSSVLRVTCAVCDRIVDGVFDFLRTYQYELYVSADVQRAHADAGGFCPMHTWQYANLASPQGICSAYPQVLFRFSEDLRRLAEGEAPKHASSGVAGPPLPAHETCLACQKALHAEQEAVRQLVGHLQAGGNGGGTGKRLCLTHLEAVLLALHDSSAGRELLLRESEVFRRVAENLQRYALKHEGRRSDLITEEEWQAPKQALTLLTGHRNVQPRFGRS
ncbi:MAG TPA: dynamin family protein [Candidatus Acidoferrum sp.]|nr:dynamin family protein [Candidatus Acidoferrum sp.]